MTEYRRKPSEVSAMKLQRGMDLSDLCSSYPVYQIDLEYTRGAATSAERGVIHCGQGELYFYIGDYIVKDGLGKLSIHSPREFEQEFEAVNADGEE